MGIAEFLERIQCVGVELSVSESGDKVRYKARKGVFTDDLKADLTDTRPI